MLLKVSNRFHAWARGWVVIAFLALDAYFMGFVMPLVGGLQESNPGAQGALDLRFFSMPGRMFEMIESYGEYGRAFYRSTELTVDLLHPILYTLGLGLLISWLFQRGYKPDEKMLRMNVVPVGAWFFDLLENLGIVILLSSFPAQWAPVAWLTTIFTMIKWIFAGASMLLILLGLVMAAKNGFKKQTAKW